MKPLYRAIVNKSEYETSRLFSYNTRMYVRVQLLRNDFLFTSVGHIHKKSCDDLRLIRYFKLHGRMRVRENNRDLAPIGMYPQIYDTLRLSIINSLHEYPFNVLNLLNQIQTINDS